MATPEIVPVNSPVAAKKWRGFALAGETAKARKAYQDFLALWKNADKEMPVLKQAKAEYAKLQ